MTIDEKRYLVASCYGDSWKEKVGKMSEYQIDALYSSFNRKGKIEDDARKEYTEIVKNRTKRIRSNYIPPTYDELIEIQKKNLINRQAQEKR